MPSTLQHPISILRLIGLVTTLRLRTQPIALTGSSMWRYQSVLCRDFTSHLSVQTTTVSFLWRLFGLSCRGKVPRGGRSDDLCSHCWTGGRKRIAVYRTEPRVTCFHKENDLVSFSRGALMLTSAERSAKSTRCKQSACIITAHTKVKTSVWWLISQTFFFLWSRFTTLDISLRASSFNPRRSRISDIIWAYFSVNAWWNDLNMAEMFYDHEESTFPLSCLVCLFFMADSMWKLHQCTAWRVCHSPRIYFMSPPAPPSSATTKAVNKSWC